MADTEQENRLKGFAQFFKGYLGVMPLITAAVSPLLTMLNAIPVFEAQKSTLATFSGLLGFLVVAWVFYARSAFVPAMIPHRIGTAVSTGRDRDEAEEMRERMMERNVRMRHRVTNTVPLILIMASIGCYVGYFTIMDSVVASIQMHHHGTTRNDILRLAGNDDSIPFETALQAFYMGIFLFAEAAFVVMALREYAYGVLKISELQVLGGVDSTSPATMTSSASSYSASEPDVVSPQAQ